MVLAEKDGLGVPDIYLLEVITYYIHEAACTVPQT